MSPRGGAGAGPVSAEAVRGAHLGTQPGSRPHPRPGAPAAAGEPEASRRARRRGEAAGTALAAAPDRGVKARDAEPVGALAEERV